MTVRTRILTAGTFVALAALLAACTPGNRLPSIEAEPLQAPSAMYRTGQYVAQRGDILAGSADLPWAFGGAVADPGKPKRPTVWVSADGHNWEQTDVDPGFSGSFSGRFAGSQELAALGGMAWKQGTMTAALWVSEDRRNWSPVDLPTDFAARYIITIMEVAGDELLAIGEATDGSVAGIRVTGSTVSEITLPQIGKGELLRPLDIASSGDKAVLLANPGPEGSQSPYVVYRSVDGGRSWVAGAVQLAEARDHVSGIAWTGSQFVATGSGFDTEVASLRARAWASIDGANWVAEEIPAVPDGGSFNGIDGADEWLGDPSANEGVISVVLSSQNAEVSAVYQRSAEGVWREVGTTSANEAAGGDGVTTQSGGVTVALLGGTGYLRTAVFAGGGYSDTLTLAHREFLAVVDSSYPAAGRRLLVVRKPVFTVDPGSGWRSTSETSLVQYRGEGAVTETSWGPEAADSLISPAIATSGGAEVIIGVQFPEGDLVVTAAGYYRQGSDAPWQPVAGFGSAGAASISAVVKTAQDWIAVGDSRESASVSAPSHAAAWTSADGLSWAAAAGEFGDGMLESRMTDVCVLPDGRPIGVGWVEESIGSYRFAAWTPTAGSWARIDVGAFDEGEGSAGDCTSDESGVVVAVSSGRDQLLRTTDGNNWSQVFRAERGESLSGPVAVPGGFAASGSWSVNGYATPVVWLSRDGSEWTPVRVPSVNPSHTSTVASHGADLVVTMPTLGGDPIVVVRDIKAVIDRLVPHSE